MGGFGRRAPSGGDYRDKFEALYFYYIFYIYIYIILIFITKDNNQIKTGQGQSSGLAASYLDLGLGS